MGSFPSPSREGKDKSFCSNCYYTPKTEKVNGLPSNFHIFLQGTMQTMDRPPERPVTPSFLLRDVLY